MASKRKRYAYRIVLRDGHTIVGAVYARDDRRAWSKVAKIRAALVTDTTVVEAPLPKPEVDKSSPYYNFNWLGK